MGINYLWDTNTAIYYLQQLLPPMAEKFIDDILKSENPTFSVITEIELRCWKTTDEKDIQLLEYFIQDAVVIDLEKMIKTNTVDIRKQYKTKLPDAIIAATALAYDLT